ncbi:protoporphyrin IX magnesium-chelatase [Rhodothalassium salexigens DSM 2132]|uniref:Mg-protoporphyrin IX chelatase n=1 Tax=Rhodothalassium salexigens DSM 2132 TaxID=1188247 RepID=A0A4R2PL61_RHOSA|nr:magnesium chelatase ATPase subunit I [Rhodothalassium salexigens]MBB4211009.1 magnesium chelatase subunit I [Rhodothalassium salexigens DSM 2132]MBK1639709.1 magnesium chelatase ATPase subunit I [Rhodothalassium salexigens DSM 2132]TCP36333.1 protoporphyrin IX magnesium-chelatase [Rhodothalassium salexigens DSM 2132]
MKPTFPFSALVGQQEMTQALMIAAVDPAVGGVLILGDRGTGKSTAVRALARLLPEVRVTEGCPYGCDPAKGSGPCGEGCPRPEGDQSEVKSHMKPVPVVDLPLGVTEDRVVGALDLERALTKGEKAFEPGLLARANRGFLYIDEVNLLEDHIVDLLLDAAASGETVVEREGLSVRHPSKFVLIGSGNPEEGDLRPQMLDRFGLSVEVGTPGEIATRVEVVRRRDAFERDPEAFLDRWADEEKALRARIVAAQGHIGSVQVPDEVLAKAAELCMELGTDGLRGELTLIRTSRALAALDAAPAVTLDHLRRVAPMALAHRLRRDPLDETGSGARVGRAIDTVLGPAAAGAPGSAQAVG